MNRSISTILSTILLILIILGVACESSIEKPPPPTGIESCTWDRKISEDTAHQIFDNWVNKWDPNGPVPPDSFFINRDSLELLVTKQNYCGFRAYYGLTRPGDMTSMGLVISAINDCDTDMLFGEGDKIFFTNISSAEIGAPYYIPRTIAIDTARRYTRNWRNYNQVCLESDVLGNQICDSSQLVRKPTNPRGVYNASIVQIVPLGLTFSGKELFKLLSSENEDAIAYIFYNSMYSFSRKKSGQEKRKRPSGYRYDLYIRGYGPNEKGNHVPLEILKDASGFAVDISGGCPFLCDDQDLLQAN